MTEVTQRGKKRTVLLLRSSTTNTIMHTNLFLNSSLFPNARFEYQSNGTFVFASGRGQVESTECGGQLRKGTQDSVK